MTDLYRKYAIFAVQSHYTDESRMVRFVIDEIAGIDGCRYEQDAAGNLLITKGVSDCYPCYTAHLDTVHPIRDDFEVCIEDGKIFARNSYGKRRGVGGDDKCGIYVCLRMLHELDACKVALFSREETGSIGSGQVDLQFFDDCSFVITNDTPDSDEIEMDTCGVSLAGEEFRDAIMPLAERFGYHKVESDFPHDGLQLVERGMRISGALPANGYYNYHQENDYVVIEELEKSVDFCREAAKLAVKRYMLEEQIQPPSIQHANFTDIFGIEMIAVEGGTFWMGAQNTDPNAPNYDADAFDWESPVHKVTLSDYFIGKYPVTQAQWKAVMGNNPSKFKGDNLPVEQVSWNDVQDFIRKLNQKTGKNYRLPTEAEWEFAARGGNQSRGYKYSGSNTADNVAWYYENAGDYSKNDSNWTYEEALKNRTHPVGTKLPNELGIYDMSGNVWEWCSDWAGGYSSGSQTNPRGAPTGSSRVIRGGNWGTCARYARVSVRNGIIPDVRGYPFGFGFRLAFSSKQAQCEREEEAAQALREREAEQQQQSKIANFTDKFGIEMIAVEGGTFWMGEQNTDPNAPNYYADDWNAESPVHQVTLSDYFIGKYPVTQAQWKAVMGNNPSNFKGDNLPVEQVSWDDVQEFISKLNQQTGKNYRLPTEAEWEFAARGGNQSRGYKYSGSNTADNVAWYYENAGDYSKNDSNWTYEEALKNRTHPVGTKLPNELGIYDMSGNVWEWCSDWYGGYSSGSQTNPRGASTGSPRVLRVLRGGSWFDFAWSARVSLRASHVPYNRGLDVGFRLAFSSKQAQCEREEEAAQALREREAEQQQQSKIANFTDKFGIEMVAVAGGTFTMGCTSEQGGDCYDWEKPAHQVTLSAFYIGKYEVTQAQWKAVMGNNPSNFKGDNLPVEQVSWNDVQDFIRKLNQKTGKNYRLPTEAEWEFAARGGNQSRGYKYSGSNTADNVAWYYENAGDYSKNDSNWTYEEALKNRTHPVGTKLPNELGIYDMSGNVWEWCSDWYGGYSSGSQTNPRGASTGSRRVIRGGSWGDYARLARVSDRNHGYPDSRYDILGFRLAFSSKQAQCEREEEAAQALREREAEQQQQSKIANFTDKFGIEMVAVAGGTFTMGCTSEQVGNCDDDEKPAHQVTLSDFYIGKYEVTQAQWEAVMGNNPSYFKGDNLPVEEVSWNDVQDFIRKLNQKTGKNYRLPTEAEWEFAARGGNQSRGYEYSGSNTADNVAWYYDNSGGKTHPVGTKQANELGIYDMSGNVWEWCSDWYGDYSNASQTNPRGASTGSGRVIRGGGWNSIARGARVSLRNAGDPGYRYLNLGFRLAFSSN